MFLFMFLLHSMLWLSLSLNSYLNLIIQIVDMWIPLSCNNSLWSFPAYEHMSGILLTNQTGWFSVCCQEYSYTQNLKLDWIWILSLWNWLCYLTSVKICTCLNRFLPKKQILNFNKTDKRHPLWIQYNVLETDCWWNLHNWQLVMWIQCNV